MLSKNEVRELVKTQRQALTPKQEAEWNDAICRKILGLRSIRQAFCVYCYVSFRHEAGTEKLIEGLLEMGKYVAVPKGEGNRLVFYAIQGKRDLESGVMGIMEPKSGCLRIRDEFAPVIVPGTAFDREGHRIGYGGGYYDRFFEEEPDHPRFAIAYPFQLMDALPFEPHDKGMDMVITP